MRRKKVNEFYNRSGESQKHNKRKKTGNREKRLGFLLFACFLKEGLSKRKLKESKTVVRVRN